MEARCTLRWSWCRSHRCGCTRWPGRGGNGSSIIRRRVTNGDARVVEVSEDQLGAEQGAAFDASSARMAASRTGAMAEGKIVI